jgi:hypothetical protein
MSGRTHGRYSGQPDGSNQRLNSIGMGPQELEALLRSLDSGAGGSARRVFARRAFRAPSIEMRLRHLTGAEVSLRVACRNLSCGGAAVLHNSYVHCGATCTLVLPRRGGGESAVRGAVARCEHRHGVVHELGIRFDEEIRLSDFLAMGEPAEQFSYEQVDPQRLEGTLMVVSGSDLHQRTLAHFLGESRVRLREVRSCAEAKAEFDIDVDLILADWLLPDGEARTLLPELRSIGCAAPFVVAAPEKVPFRPEPGGPVPNARLKLPFCNEDVLRCLAEFLLAPGQATGTGPEAGGEVIEGLNESLMEAARSLEVAIAGRDGIGCYSLCMTIQSLAESAGRTQLATVAAQAASALGGSLDVEVGINQLRTLIRACGGTSDGAWRAA